MARCFNNFSFSKFGFKWNQRDEINENMENISANDSFGAFANTFLVKDLNNKMK